MLLEQQVYGWDIHGSITFNDVNCSENVATRWGGCFFGAGSNVFNDGTVMLANQAEKGGCICEPNMSSFVLFFFLIQIACTAATNLLSCGTL